MKINSLIKKTALAVAVAGVSFTAAAGSLTVTTPSVVAVELFGDAKNDYKGSNKTSITLPVIEFLGADQTSGALAAGGGTIKLTLANTHAVFSSNFNTASDWATQGVVIKVGGVELDDTNVTSVDAGTQDNNVIIIHTDLDLNGKDVSIAGLKVWNLKDTHQSLTGKTMVNVELTDKSGGFDSTPNKVAIYSARGVNLVGNVTNYDEGASSTRGYIEVDSAQQKFTDAITGFVDFDNPTSAPHRDVFSADDATEKLYLGELNISRGFVEVGSSIHYAGNEQGSNFQISGGDTLKLNVTADADLKNYGLALWDDESCAANQLSTSTTLSADGKVAEIELSGVSLDSSNAYHLCATSTATGGERLPQIGTLTANVSVDYTNVRYGTSAASLPYGKVLRNGCSVTLFNLPSTGVADVGNIRFTNTSDDDKGGDIAITVWGQDGSKLAENVSLGQDLAAHATVLLHTDPKATNGVFLGDFINNGESFSGRARIQINGAFPKCEALGLVRTKTTGNVVNMTSTVYSDGQNGTSNTTN